MMKNKAEELAPLDLLLIPFLIYKIKEGQPRVLMTLQMRRLTLVKLHFHMVDREVEDSGNRITEAMMNTN